MSVPNFQELMLPLLQLAADGGVHTQVEAVQTLADLLELSDDDRKEVLPSGRQTRFANRVQWARAHLKAAGLVESVGRGEFRLTTEGKAVLATRPPKITMKFLSAYPSYLAFRTPKGPVGDVPLDSESSTEATPEESLESSYLALRKSLAQELLDRVRSMSPAVFERLVVDVLVAMGYRGSRQDAGQAVGQSGDGRLRPSRPTPRTTWRRSRSGSCSSMESGWLN